MTGPSGKPRPKRSLGQNFLQDDNICRKIVGLLEIGPEDRVLEIGPGQGALTRFLMESGARLVRVLEKDDHLAAGLAVRWPELEVTPGDALAYDWDRLEPAGSWKVVGNLPYNVASPIMWEVASRAGQCGRAVFMIQKEVAQRLCAGPGSRTYGALSVWIQSFARTRLAFIVPPTVFYPRPKVDSAVVVLDRIPEERPFDRGRLSLIVKRCFQQRRKQLKTILKKEWSSALESTILDLGLDPAIRPERIRPDQYQALSNLDKIAFGP